ncbi:MAG: Holliday junction resolvase RuvX [Candidatus Paceibacterota bacterium]
MKYLGIDFGTKKVGLALSDESGTFANPLKVIPNNDDLVNEIKRLCAEHEVSVIVLGLSTNFKGEDNPVMKEARQVKEVLERDEAVKVELEPEFLTTAHAARTEENKATLDASAAALILQSFLDRHKE